MIKYDNNTVFVKGIDGKFHVDEQGTKAAQAEAMAQVKSESDIPRACIGGMNTAMSAAYKAAKRANVDLDACALMFREDLGKYIFTAEGKNAKGKDMNIPILVDVA